MVRGNKTWAVRLRQVDVGHETIGLIDAANHDCIKLVAISQPQADRENTLEPLRASNGELEIFTWLTKLGAIF